MADFNTAVAMVLDHEGGYSAPSPTYPDAGGHTNYGVSQNVYSRYLGRPATADDVKNMPIGHARDIYQKWYWNLILADKIADQNVANWLLDMAVLRGVQAAAIAAQNILGVKADGAFGPISVGALNKFDSTTFLALFWRTCVAGFVRIVTQKPDQLIFLSNWTQRIGRIANLFR